MSTCEKCGTEYHKGDVICVWCGNILTKSDTYTPRIRTTREKQKDLKKQLTEIVKAHENDEIGEGEFKKKKSEIAKKISEIKAQRTISKYKEPYTEPETYKTPPRGGARKQKPSNWWYLTPLFFNIFGGIIAYFAIRKQNYKMARNMIDIGGFMLLLLVVSVAFLPGIISNFQGQEIINESLTSNLSTKNGLTVSIFPAGFENTSIDRVSINKSYVEACQILGLFSNQTSLQKEEIFRSDYKDKYITWEGAILLDAIKESDGYIIHLEHERYLGCDIVARINLDQKEKFLNYKIGDDITLTARLVDYDDLAGKFYAIDGEIVV